MLSNAYFLAKFRFHTAENEPAKNLQKEIAKFSPAQVPHASPRRAPEVQLTFDESTWADASEREREEARAMDLRTLLTAREATFVLTPI